MGVIKIKDEIYSVGVLNPNLRVFDIIMRTDYGTSYNSYIVKGEKTVLIDTAHEKYFEEYLENILQVTPVEKIDYIVMNHTEPDHSGSLYKLLEMNPSIQVVSSKPASMYLKGISNTNFESIVVKDGDTLDIGGGRVLQFIIAPFLHWPDSMFTYLESDKLVFTCDFLGAHYCETRMIDEHITYPEEYEEAFEYYYRAIFGPFKKHVMDGLAKLKELDFDTVCPSHGPVLRERIADSMAKYDEWSRGWNDENHPKKVLIAYVSAYGYTRKLAEALAEGAQSAGAEVELVDIIKKDMGATSAALHEADGIMLGSPTINRDALAPVMNLCNTIDAISNRGKLCFVFGSYGWSGEAVATVSKRIETLGLKLYGEGMRVNFKPTEDDLVKAKQTGEEFVKAL